MPVGRATTGLALEDSPISFDRNGGTMACLLGRMMDMGDGKDLFSFYHGHSHGRHCSFQSNHSNSYVVLHESFWLIDQLFCDNDERMLVVLDSDGTPRPQPLPGGGFATDSVLCLVLAF